jgi:hypothetical protein
MWFKKSMTPKVSHQEDFEFLAERDMARLLEAPTGARYLTYAVLSLFDPIYRVGASSENR